MIKFKMVAAVAAALVFTACSSNTDTLLKNKKWRVYDVQVPANTPFNNTQITQAKDLKSGYYSNVYYQFLDNNVFIATVDNVPDTGHYEIISNGKVISITPPKSENRSVEHLVSVEKLSEQEFDMKVKTDEFYFILKTKRE
ncbi:hypothetical protein LX64_02411 [Chitinophaga skermanii]|uniref:Lipocalin-like protein n=1 Tax=Chitinophaga skermanii TaxID=331697 RepID=A0A327QKS1_9BACT|nr:hypothetical protein [Chitinophaga skermanii]RAJ05256.1 hypothetical protein LX64_02411 [Chitinophaga skermanii]